ncbi:CocE/NonD family hydrolase [Chloroflexota bacterium]
MFDDYNGAMFGTKWKASERKYGVVVETDVKIRLPDGVKLSCDVFRPDSEGKYPAILGYHCYHQSGQTGPIKPGRNTTAWVRNPGEERTRASLESGDPNFFVRRGYVHVLCNTRGTGKSEGKWDFTGPIEVQDAYEVIEWIATQPWCDGNVGMFGISYFGWAQLFAATLNPPHLKAIFCPDAATDLYRDLCYSGGILIHRWLVGWSRSSLTYADCRPENHSKNELGEEGYRNAIAELLQNDDIKYASELIPVLKDPEAGPNPFIMDVALHPFYDKFWEERTVNYEKIKVPAYIGASWVQYRIHLPAAFRSWEKLDVPKKMLIYSELNLDRPLYQLQHEAVRWFDYWMKGIDTGIMDEPPVRLLIRGTNEWKESTDWPLPETKWTPFYLHEDGLLFEHEHWPNEGSDSYEDSPWMRGSLKYATPMLIENTEVVGPIMLKLYASTTDTEILWVVWLLEIDPQGKETVLTKGWLRGSHRELDMQQSKPWEPIYTHAKSEPLTPGNIYEFNIKVVPTGTLFKAGSRIGLKISSVDEDQHPPYEADTYSLTLRRTSPSRVTVFHNEDYPSYLLLPITKGNILQTYLRMNVEGPKTYGELYSTKE